MGPHHTLAEAPPRSPVRPLVAGLADRLPDRAAAIEETRGLPADVVSALRASGVPDLWVPRELGGSEASPTEVLDAIEVLAAGDASTGWCAAVTVGTNALAAYLPEEGAREIFATPGTIAGGSFNPAGRATEVGGGLRVSGRWAFGSGSGHADWLCGGCVVVDGSGRPVVGDDGRPDGRLVFFRAAEAVIHDTWHVSGLRGTGSHDFEVAELDVPLRRTMTFAFRPWPQGALWGMPPMSLFFSPLAAVALGAAGAAIDDVLALATEKTPYRSNRVLAEREVVQSMVARAEALVGSARAFLRETLEGLLEASRRGDEITLRQRASARLAVVNASSAGKGAVDLCAEAAGSSALFVDRPLGRRFRDVHAAAGHVALAFPGFETVGRVMLGLDPDTPLL